MNELIAVKSIVSQRIETHMQRGLLNSDTYSVSIRDRDNKVFIGVPKDTGEELIFCLTHGLDAPLLGFFQSAPLQVFLNLKPGDSIDSGEAGSALFRLLAQLYIKLAEQQGLLPGQLSVT